MDTANTLNTRTLWHDGSLSLTPTQIIAFLQAGNVLSEKIYTTDLSAEDVVKYNNFAEAKLNIKNSMDSINTEWNIPAKYKEMNVDHYVYEKLLKECEKIGNSPEVQARVSRTKAEIELFKQHNIFDLLRTLIYIVDEMENNKVVWGTGRGSSCSSYILYLIGLHNVDSVKYELNINEFLR